MTTPDLIIRKLDEAYVIVDCAEESTQADLHSYFTFKAPDYQYHPLYRAKKWNGNICLYSKLTQKLPVGLLRYVLAFSKERNLKTQVKDNLDLLTNFSLSDAEAFIRVLEIHSGGNPLTPHEHQVMGLAKAIRYKRILLQSPTSSGKSYLMYTIMRYLLTQKLGGCKRGLIIVPTVNLVEQLYTDFLDYSTTPNYSTWRLETYTQRVYEGHSPDVDPYTKVIISTWQSIYDLPADWFQQFDFVIGDEAHGFKAESLKKIMGALTNAKYRIGTTGTLNEWKVHRLVIEGHFGPLSKLTTTKELQDKGVVAKSKINGLVLKYPKKQCSTLLDAIKSIYRTTEKHQAARAAWKHEMDFLVHHTKRTQFISKLALSLKGNVLVLFNFKEHGDLLHDWLLGRGKQVHLVTGDTVVAQREQVRHLTEANDGLVILASYGVFSTGVNIKNLHHVVFASPSKSKVRVLQSIGRGLRLKEGKTQVTIHDLTDDLRTDKWINITLKHYVARLNIYKQESWTVSSYLIEL